MFLEFALFFENKMGGWGVGVCRVGWGKVGNLAVLPVTYTVAPALPRATATPLPTPRVAPVTTTTWPLRSQRVVRVTLRTNMSKALQAAPHPRAPQAALAQKMGS